MIIKVEQTNANLKSKFEIRVNNQLKYLAGTPWMDFNLPLELDKKRSCIMTELDGSVRYITAYNIIENFKNTAIPMKWLFTGEEKRLIYYIVDGKKNICGRFYQLRNGYMDYKFIIEVADYKFICYDVAMGRTRNILIYDGETQIGEIVKPLHVRDNLDYYYIFLLDEYKGLEDIFSFFTIVFDHIYYSNSSEVVSQKEEYGVSYSIGKNNKYYNKEWILQHFFGEEVDYIYNEFIFKKKKKNKEAGKTAIYIILFIILCIAISVIILGMVYKHFG